MTLKESFESYIHYPWDEFVEIEKGDSQSIDDSTLISLIRVCTDTDDISAIKMSFDRIDDMLETPVQIKVPKFYIRYTNAKEIEQSDTKQLEAASAVSDDKTTTYDPATAKLRETLREMRGMPQGIVPAILKVKIAVDEGKTINIENGKMPQVKHVIVANLLKNVRNGKFKAIELVFDQIDGKLTRTIALLGGDDVYVDDPVPLIAPAGATKDANGYYIAENKLMTTAWIRGFANNQKGLEILTKGLEE